MVSSTPRPHFTPEKDPVPILQESGWAPGPVWTGGKSRPHRDSIPDRPARSQSLYRLSYPAHTHHIMMLIIMPLIETYWICCQHCSGVHTPVGMSYTLRTYLCTNYIHLLKQACFLRSQTAVRKWPCCYSQNYERGYRNRKELHSFVINKNNSRFVIPSTGCS